MATDIKMEANVDYIDDIYIDDIRLATNTASRIAGLQE